MNKKQNDKKKKLVKEILKIYEYIYDYDRNDLIYCYEELYHHKSFYEVKYINTRLKEINSSKIEYLNLFNKN